MFKWLRRAVAHVFGDQVLLISNDLVLAFIWLLVIWVSSFFSSSISFALLSCVGVDNALIKGEIANTRLICVLIVRL